MVYETDILQQDSHTMTHTQLHKYMYFIVFYNVSLHHAVICITCTNSLIKIMLAYSDKCFVANLNCAFFPPPLSLSLSLDAPSGKCVSKIDNYSDAVSSSFDLLTLTFTVNTQQPIMTAYGMYM